MDRLQHDGFSKTGRRQFPLPPASGRRPPAPLAVFPERDELVGRQRIAASFPAPRVEARGTPRERRQRGERSAERAREGATRLPGLNGGIKGDVGGGVFPAFKDAPLS